MMVWSKEGTLTRCSIGIVRCNTLVVQRCRQLIGPADWVPVTYWDPYAVISLEVVAYSWYCNTVEVLWWHWSPSQWPTDFLWCFKAVGWVIWPVKFVPEITYKVLSGMLSTLTHSQSNKGKYWLTALCLVKLHVMAAFSLLWAEFLKTGIGCDPITPVWLAIQLSLVFLYSVIN